MFDDIETIHRTQVYAFVLFVLFVGLATAACTATWAVLKYAAVA